MKRFQIFIIGLLLGVPVFCQQLIESGTGVKEDIRTITERLVSACLEQEADVQHVARWMCDFRPDGSFSDLSYEVSSEKASFPCGVHLKRLKEMALAYRKQGCRYYESDELLSKLMKGVDFWFRTRPVSANWWFNDIGVPQDYMHILILLKGYVDKDLLRHYSSYLRDVTGNKAHRGKNRTWVSDITLHKGCIEDDASLVHKGFESIASTLHVSTRQNMEGIKADGSFHQHRFQLYTGGYGLSYVDDISRFLILADGTVFCDYFTPEHLQVLRTLLFKGCRLLGYRNTFDFGAVGRNISRDIGLNNIASQTLERMERIDSLHACDYAAWRAHLAGSSFPAPGNTHFWESDIMVQHGANYYLSAKIISERTNGTEMLNGENKRGYNLPLGATNILVSGREYRQIFLVWDWARIPGTTAVQHPDSTLLSGYLFGRNRFGGGVSNGQMGALAYEHDYRGVKAHKAYFFFDDLLLCLGTGIASDAPDEVVTTVNQCLFDGKMVASSKGKELLYTLGDSVADPDWVYHNGTGYLFPAGNSRIIARNQTQCGSWKAINDSGEENAVSADVFQLTIHHGIKPRNGSYAYAVVPDVSLDEFRTYMSDKLPEVIINKPEVQAVSSGQTYMAVFYQPGSICLQPDLRLQTAQPSLFCIQRQENGWHIAVSDPLCCQQEICFALNGREVRMKMPGGECVGSTTLVTVADVQPCELLCEYLEQPLGIDIRHPRLSWQLGTTLPKRGQYQIAYQVLVASSKALLESNNGDLWDSGIVHSAESVNIDYAGKPLIAGQLCYWKVRILNEEGHWSAWSQPAYWRMGLFPQDWTAQWIGSAEMEALSVGGKKVDNRIPDPWLRRTFTLEDTPRDAVLYVASIGYHELYVNGKKVGDAVLVPSVTDHRNRARYMAYDITALLQPDTNVIALWLGTSWSIFPAYQRTDKPAIPMVMAQAEITQKNGDRLCLISDEHWKVHASPNTLMGYWEAHHFAGEFYDASLEIDNWNKSSFDDSAWASAKVYSPDIKISADLTEPNRLVREIRPLSVDEIRPGTYRIDMGVNYAGWFKIKFEGEPGDTIQIQFSERKEDTCSFGIQSFYKVGTRRTNVFCNRFNYMAGRYVTVSGLQARPSLDDVQGWMIRPDYRKSGTFECDIPLLNAIYNTTLWSFENLSLGNYVVDCPHRERCGYGGDALATTRTALNNYRLPAFYYKWMEDWRDVQDADGNVPYTAPTRIGGGGPSWSGFCVTLPWEFYRQYGDVRILEESFSTIGRWLAFLETKSQADMLVRWGGKWSFLGDWLWPQAWPERRAMEAVGKALGDTRETLFFNNCCWIYQLETAAKIATVLGKKTEANAWHQRAMQVRKAVHAAFYDAENHSYVNGYSAYLAMALYVGLPPQSLHEEIWKKLEHEILVTRKGHFWGGITAGSFLFHTLLDNHRDDLIYEVVTKTDFPSWGYMLEKGNGTFFEDWECNGSAMHSSYLYIGSWFTEGLGGIRSPQGGYRHFVIKPWISVNGKLKNVRSSHRSLYGNIVSNWHIQNDGLVYVEVLVPANTTAELYLDHICVDTIKEQGKPYQEVTGVKLCESLGGKAIFRLQSGRYEFTAKLMR